MAVSGHGRGPASRNAIYQALFEARRKIAARLAVDDVHHAGRLPAVSRSARWLNALLVADPGDTGCDLAFQALDRYAEADVLGELPQGRYPGVATHLASCAACRQDYEGMLAGGVTSATRPRQPSG